LTVGDITEAFNQKSSTKTKSKKSKASSKPITGKTHTMKGVKLPPKYKNPADPSQTWTGRGVDPIWIAKLRESGQLESALISTPI
jgi:DNA-binding protein H-NS